MIEHFIKLLIEYLKCVEELIFIYIHLFHDLWSLTIVRLVLNFQFIISAIANITKIQGFFGNVFKHHIQQMAFCFL